jgi:two-component system chemotaxis response regulator CheY
MVPELRRILILEDSPMMCSLYRMVLGGAAELEFAADGVEGLDQAARGPDVDLYIVDVNMPRLDGIRFIERLRGELGVEATPVLVVSTECGPQDRARAEKAGANGYLCKPWKPADLMQALADLDLELAR